MGVSVRAGKAKSHERPSPPHLQPMTTLQRRKAYEEKVYEAADFGIWLVAPKPAHSEPKAWLG